MKTLCCRLRPRLCLILSLAVSICGINAFAQTTSNIIPVVTIWATTPVASPGHPGVFSVFRQGDTSNTLNVFYDIGGTASNGVDYATISQWVTIPAGTVSNSITITPLYTGVSKTNTVVLQLASPPTLNPVNYEIGTPSNAIVYIVVISNTPSRISITTPKNGAVFYTPTNIYIAASLAADSISSPTNVEFFAGANDLGKGSPGSISGFSGGAHLTWTNPTTGSYALTAVASYADRLSVTSAPVNITVLQGPPTNLPPVVNIIEPTNGETFTAPASVQILAKATDSSGSISNVEFFAGTHDLGKGNPVVLDPPGVGGVTGLVYLFNWASPSPGSYPLTAVATDNNGGAGTSAPPVNITVLAGPPPTNVPPVVRIVSPANGSMFHAPVNVPLIAYANDSDDAVASVQFFDGANSLGFGQRLPFPIVPVSTNPVPAVIVYPTNLYFLVWSNAPIGTNLLTAVATDAIGLSSTSAPVFVAVLPPPPPPTNRPTIVDIVATDPVAVEGTNCWVWPGETNATPTWAAWSTAILHPYTNCGPKTATFTVRRWGDTNNSLTVPYAVSGTASNGVDYIALSGAVTIPPGERRALIPIIPIDDGPPDVNSTVILTLTSSTNIPPDYVVGYPYRAAAIIIDSPGQWPFAGVLPDTCFRLAIPGPDAAWFCVQRSADLVNWTSICTNQVVNGSIDFIDPDTGGKPSGYYRAIPVASPPAD